VREVAFPIHLRTTITAKGETTEPTVVCPRYDRSIDAHACAGCMRMRALEWDAGRGGEVVCLLSGNPEPRDPRCDFGELAARVHVQDVTSRSTLCVTPDVSLDRIRTIFETDRERAIAIVDDDGKLQGILSRTDLARASATMTTEETMTKKVHALPENAPISYAISLMALEDISEVPVVTGEGKVVGICHALDVMRWVAAHLGYTQPKP